MCLLIRVCIESTSPCGSCAPIFFTFFTSRALFSARALIDVVFFCSIVLSSSTLQKFATVIPFVLFPFPTQFVHSKCHSTYVSCCCCCYCYFLFGKCFFSLSFSLSLSITSCDARCCCCRVRIFRQIVCVCVCAKGGTSKTSEGIVRANRVNSIPERANKTTNSILLQHWIGDGTQQVADNSWHVLCCILYVCDCDYDCTSCSFTWFMKPFSVSLAKFFGELFVRLHV